MLAGGVIGPRGSLPHGPSRVDAKRGGHLLQADFPILINCYGTGYRYSSSQRNPKAKALQFSRIPEHIEKPSASPLPQQTT
jgi:hypothetical protein